MQIYTIYLITNKINGKTYVGFDSNWPTRKTTHINNVNTNRYPNLALYKAMKKYRVENFSWEILYQSLDRDHTLNIMEPHFIAETNSYIHSPNSNGYNLTTGGEGTFGYKHTNEHKEHMRILNTGKVVPKDVVGKMVNTKRERGCKRTPGSFKKGNIPWSKGKKMDEEYSKTCSRAQKKRFEDPIEYEKLSKARELGRITLQEKALYLLVKNNDQVFSTYRSIPEFCKTTGDKPRIIYHHATKNSGKLIQKGKYSGYVFWLLQYEEIQKIINQNSSSLK